MTLAIMQPAAGPEAKRHYSETIVRPIDPKRIATHTSSSDYSVLQASLKGTPVRAWGVTPGANGSNYTRWQRMSPSDIVFFTGGGEAFSTARLLAKLHSKELARDLWGTDEDGMTWEYMYFITDVLPCSIPYHRIASAANFKRSWIPLGFSVLTPEQSQRVLALLD